LMTRRTSRKAFLGSGTKLNTNGEWLASKLAPAKRSCCASPAPKLTRIGNIRAHFWTDNTTVEGQTVLSGFSSPWAE
jgi:hypothetical protein